MIRLRVQTPKRPMQLPVEDAEDLRWLLPRFADVETVVEASGAEMLALLERIPPTS